MSALGCAWVSRGHIGQYRLHLAVVSTMYSTGSASQPGAPRQVAPQKFGAIPGPHALAFIVPAGLPGESQFVMEQRVRLLNDAPVAPRGGTFSTGAAGTGGWKSNHALAFAAASPTA